jgi:hypothetical protein
MPMTYFVPVELGALRLDTEAARGQRTGEPATVIRQVLVGQAPG